LFFFVGPNIFSGRLKLKRETKIFSSSQSGRKAEIFRRLKYLETKQREIQRVTVRKRKRV
jgi:hypothetical protein